MPVTYLREQRRAVLNGVAQSGLFIGGQKVWAAPKANPLLAHYGTGLGQIPLHLDPRDAVVSGGKIVSIANKGGAGAHFNAVPGSTAIPRDANNNLTLVQGARLTLANTADVQGVRFFSVINLTDVSINQYPFGNPLRSNFEAATKQFVIQYQQAGTWLTARISLSPQVTTGWHLYEVQADAAKVTVWIDGIKAGETASPFTILPVNTIFATGAGTQGITGQAGSVLSLITDGTHKDAINTIRAELSAGRPFTAAQIP